MALSEEDKLKKDVLWGMYQENCTQGRHHETQRATVTNLIIVIVGALVGVMSWDKAIARGDAAPAAFIIILGLFGAAFTTKHYERFSLHMMRARKYRNEIDKLFFASALIKRLKQEGDDDHKKDSPALNWWYRHEVRLHELWLVFHLLVAAIGVAILTWAICWPGQPS